MDRTRRTISSSVLVAIGLAAALAIVVVLAFVARASVADSPATVAGLPTWTQGGAILGVLALVVLLVRARSRRAPRRENGGADGERDDGSSPRLDDGSGQRGGDESDDEPHSVWNLIPSWQYTGIHAESGGITRDGQEKALDAIQQRADELERREEYHQRRDP